MLHSYIENAQSINAPSKWTGFSVSSCLIQVFSQNDKWGQIKRTIRGCIHPKRDAPTEVYCEIYHVWCCEFTVRDHMLITYCERFWIMRNTEREGEREREGIPREREREREPLCSKRDIACSILTVRVLNYILYIIYWCIYWCMHCGQSQWQFLWSKHQNASIYMCIYCHSVCPRN